MWEALLSNPDPDYFVRRAGELLVEAGMHKGQDNPDFDRCMVMAITLLTLARYYRGPVHTKEHKKGRSRTQDPGRDSS